MGTNAVFIELLHKKRLERYYIIFYEHNVYKHTEAHIFKKLSIFQAYFWSSFFISTVKINLLP